MALLTIYSSTKAWPRVLTIALDLQAKGYQLHTLSRLPKPQPVRVASLRLELAALQQDERTIRWVLSQYAEGLRLPDADRVRDLRDDLDVTLWQLENVKVKLRTLLATGEELA